MIIDKLEGSVINDKWKLEKLINTSNISNLVVTASYFAKSNNQEGFLKFFDKADYVNSDDLSEAYSLLASCIGREKKISVESSTRNLRRLVTLIDSDSYRQDIETGGGIYSLQAAYIVFEKAEANLLQLIDISQIIDLSVFFLMMQHVSTGLLELHSMKIAHQNVKATSVFKYGESSFKLGDFKKIYYEENGKPNNFGYISEFDNHHFNPIEKEFGINSPDVAVRFSQDLYSLGNMVFFYLTNMSITSLYLEAVFDKEKLTIPDFNNSLPIFIEVLEKALNTIRELLSEYKLVFEKELIDTMRELLYPDPTCRGNLRYKNKHYLQYNVQRYVSKFDRFSQLCKYYGKKRHV